MENNSSQINKLSLQIDQYLNCYGKARIGIYILPKSGLQGQFSAFTNSLCAALQRYDLTPAYFWVYNMQAECYILVVMIRGHFKADASDITKTVNRLWRQYSSAPVGIAGDQGITTETQFDDKMQLIQTLQQVDFDQPMRRTPDIWHQRLYACSHVI